MRLDILPEWLRSLDLWVLGFEGDPPPKDDKTADNEDDGDDEDEDDDEGSSDEGEEKKGAAKDDSGLKSALSKERRERKKLEKQLRKATKAQEEANDKDLKDSDKAIKAAEKAQEQTVKLAAKLKDNAIDMKILKFASKFNNVDDAIRLVDRKLIEVEQDEDEPADIEIDETSVEEAVKQLAKAEPHLVKKDGDEGASDRSGSKFGGKSKDKDSSTEDELKEKYPALRR